MDKQNMVYAYMEYYSAKKKRNDTLICYNMNGPRKHHA